MRNNNRKERFEFQLDNRQIALLVMGSMILLGAVFSLGVLTGRDLAAQSRVERPALEQRSPASPLEELDTREEQLAAAARPQGEDATGQAAQAGGEVAQAPVQAAPPTIAAEQVKPQLAPPPAPSKPAVVEQAKPQPAPAPPPPKPAESEKGEWCLQYASFSTRAEAVVESARISSKGVKANVTEGSVKGRSVYRVRSGAWATKVDGESARAQIVKKVGGNPMLVPCK